MGNWGGFKKLAKTLRAVFSKEEKKSLSNGLPTPTSKEISFDQRLSLFLTQSVQFADLNNQAQLLQKEGGVGEEFLSALEKSLAAHQAQLARTNDHRKNLLSQIGHISLEVPSEFRKTSKFQEQWQERIDILQAIVKEEYIVSEQFESEKAFNDWISQKKRETEKGFRALSPFLCAKALEKKIQSLCQEQESILPFLYRVYVEDFFSEFEKELFYSNGADVSAATAHCLAIIEFQQAALFRLDKEVKGDYASLKKKALPLIEKLYKPELALYKDLPLQLDKVLKSDFEIEPTPQKILTTQVLLQFGQLKDQFFEKLYNESISLVERGKKRNEKIEQIEFFQKQISQIIDRLKLFKDLTKEKQDLEEKIHAIAITKQELYKIPFENIEKVIDEKYQLYLELSSVIPQLILSLNQRCRQQELWCEYGKQTIKRRIFEIFFNITPYKELEEDFSSVRAILVQRLVQLVDAFYAGSLSSEEYLAACQEMAYEHDVVKLRNEITYRATRLKDIRDEVIQLSRTISKHRRLLTIILDTAVDKVYSQMQGLLKEIFELLHRVENPFQLFFKAQTKDETNLIFRSIWIEVEKLQARAEQIKEQSELILKSNAEAIKARLLRVADNIEEVIYQEEGTRPIIVEQMKNNFRYLADGDVWAAVINEHKALEKKFTFTFPLSFFLQINDSKLCIELLTAARKVDERISKVYSFAKTMQYIKTFEEEYVDVILEAFERQHLLEDTSSDNQSLKKAWETYLGRMYYSCVLVEEEILLDIGLLDMRALMDVDQMKLQKILRLAIDRAHQYVKNPSWGPLKQLDMISHLSSSEAKLCQKTRQELRDLIVAWDTEALLASDSRLLLERLRIFCQYLFDVKVLMAASKNHLLAKSLAFIEELRVFSILLEQWLQKKRQALGVAWNKSWIAECYILRRDIERFEVQANGIESLKAFMVRIFSMVSQIPEIIQQKGEEADFEKMMEEMRHHLQEIEAIKPLDGGQIPLFYTPGYLAFFKQEP